MFDIIPDQQEKDKITRSLQVLEMMDGEVGLRFQYGMHNPDFPATIRKQLFLMDFYAYLECLISKETDFDDKMKLLHGAIDKMVTYC